MPRKDEELPPAGGFTSPGEEFLQLLFERHPQPMWVYDLETHAFLAVNDAAVEHYGYTREEFLAMRIQDIRPEEDLAALERHLADAPAGREHAGLWRHRRRDGTILLAEVVSHDLPFAGRPARVVTAQDVTARAAAEQALSDVEDRFRTAFDSAPVGLTIIAPDGRSLFRNRAYHEMLGYTEEDMERLTFEDVTHPDDLERDMRQVERMFAGEIDCYEDDKRYLHRDGRVIYTHMRRQLVREADGTPRYVVSQILDVTERRAMELQLAERLSQQAAVAELGKRALAAASVEQLTHDAVELVAQTLGVAIAEYLGIEHGAGGGLGLEAAVGPTAALVGNARVESSPDTPAGRALATGAPVLVEDYAADTDVHAPPWLREHGAVSGVSVVVAGHDEPFGVLGAHAIEERRFGEDDANFLQSVANVLASAIERRRAEDDTRHRALHDPLTGLPNRALLLDRLTVALAHSQRSKDAVAVLFMDIDRFKVINDGLGHGAGDELLCAIAPRIRECLRPGDTVARFGGDEFVVVCDGIADERRATHVAERIAGAFARPFMLSSGEHFVTASIGIALSSGPRHDAEQLIRDADAAMYRAKERGRARYELFDDVMRARAMGRLRTEHELRRALEGDEILVYYQPIVTIPAGAVVGVEALARWQHPDRGLLPPAEFIAVAEDSGQISALGQRVLERACAQVARWQARRPDATPLGVSVNLSARQVAAGGLVEGVEAALGASGLDPSTLSLEITEGLLLDDAEATMRTLGRLRELGVKLALDDFGTGFSALGYVRRFPVDTIKIDRGFVAELDRGDAEMSIVEAIVHIARGLRAEVIAEGVETEAQAALLRACGCTRAQGFFYAEPMPAEELEPLLDVCLPVEGARRG